MVEDYRILRGSTPVPRASHSHPRTSCYDNVSILENDEVCVVARVGYYFWIICFAIQKLKIAELIHLCFWLYSWGPAAESDLTILTEILPRNQRFKLRNDQVVGLFQFPAHFRYCLLF
jgi:hypothetical protein